MLLQALSFYDRSVCIDSDTGDEKPVEPNSRFVAKCILDNESKHAFAACFVFVFFIEGVKRN